MDFITKAVFKYNGTINKLLGDGVLVIFGDPVEQKDHGLNAIKTALKIKENLHKLVAKFSNQPTEIFRLGLGIHTGSVIIGNVGAGEHIDYTAIGSSVNLAARLQSMSTENNIIISQSSIAPYDSIVNSICIEAVQIKGFEKKIAVCEVLGLKNL